MAVVTEVGADIRQVKRELPWAFRPRIRSMGFLSRPKPRRKLKVDLCFSLDQVI